jgi:MYXO-CTERM domain-containing protein
MRAPGWLVGCFVLSVAWPALAAPSSVDGEREDLERQLAHDYSALSTSDCGTACRALSSMQRAAERICALAPGKSCDDARAKVEDARRRVKEQCPTCVVDTPHEDTGSTVAQPPPAPASAPASERARGGCAGCATSGAHGEPAGGAVTLLLGVLAFRRARRRPPARARD